MASSYNYRVFGSSASEPEYEIGLKFEFKLSQEYYYVNTV